MHFGPLVGGTLFHLYKVFIMYVRGLRSKIPNGKEGPISLSLQGPQKLYLFQLSEASIPTPEGTLEMSAGCYLVTTGDGKRILVDTGFPVGFQPPAGSPPARFRKTVHEHLAALGLKAADIDTVICTHLDIDHAGGNGTFAHAELVVQREHYEVAHEGHPRFAAGRPHWDHPDLRYRLVEGDTELLPGLTLLETSGHVPGHQSVLVRLPQTGVVLLAIDAVSLQRSFTPERKAGPLDMDEERLRASTRKLLEVVKRESAVLVVFHHDGLQWQKLKKSPEFYA